MMMELAGACEASAEMTAVGLVVEMGSGNALVAGSAAREMIGGMRGCLRDPCVLIGRLGAGSVAAAFKVMNLMKRDLRTDAAD